MSIDPLVASMSCILTIRCSVVAGATLTGLYSHHYLDALSNIYDIANGPVITIAGTTPPLTYPANGSALEKFNTHSNADSLEVRLGSTGSGPLQNTLGGRYSQDKRPGSSFITFSGLQTPPPQTFNKFTYRAAAQRDFAEHSILRWGIWGKDCPSLLIASTYATVSRVRRRELRSN
jgi:hypothetical protein